MIPTKELQYKYNVSQSVYYQYQRKWRSKRTETAIQTII